MPNKTSFHRAFVMQTSEIQVTGMVTSMVPARTTVFIKDETENRVYGQFALPDDKFICGWIPKDKLAADLNDRNMDTVKDPERIQQDNEVIVKAIKEMSKIRIKRKAF